MFVFLYQSQHSHVPEYTGTLSMVTAAPLSEMTSLRAISARSVPRLPVIAGQLGRPFSGIK